MSDYIEDFELTPYVPEVIKKSKKSPLEKKVEERLRVKVKAMGGYSWKFVSPNNRGVSDRVVIYKGRVIFVEVKRDKGKMTALQQTFRERVFSHGGEFTCVYGFDGVDGFIEKLKEGAEL